MMKRYCLALDLKNDLVSITEYEYWHKNCWPEVKQSIIDSGIINMEIYRTGNRLFMIMETEDEFSFIRKDLLDASNIKVQEWETFMWKYQQPLPDAKPGEKWVVMNKIFELA